MAANIKEVAETVVKLAGHYDVDPEDIVDALSYCNVITKQSVDELLPAVKEANDLWR